MGRQITFYMVRDDEAEFLEHLCAEQRVAVAGERSNSEAIQILDALPEAGTAEARTGVLLWNRDITPSIELKHLGPGSFVVDKDNDEVIEWHRSEIYEGVLQPGRLWIETTRHDPELGLVPKSRAFVGWFNSIARWIRSHYAKGLDGDYIAPHAQRWASRGGCIK